MSRRIAFGLFSIEEQQHAGERGMGRFEQNHATRDSGSPIVLLARGVSPGISIEATVCRGDSVVSKTRPIPRNRSRTQGSRPGLEETPRPGGCISRSSFLRVLGCPQEGSSFSEFKSWDQYLAELNDDPS